VCEGCRCVAFHILTKICRRYLRPSVSVGIDYHRLPSNLTLLIPGKLVLSLGLPRRVVRPIRRGLVRQVILLTESRVTHSRAQSHKLFRNRVFTLSLLSKSAHDDGRASFTPDFVDCASACSLAVTKTVCISLCANNAAILLLTVEVCGAGTDPTTPCVSTMRKFQARG